MRAITVPRTRGDEPTWEDETRRLARPFPARAGMNRLMNSDRPDLIRSPHARG